VTAPDVLSVFHTLTNGNGIDVAVGVIVLVTVGVIVLVTVGVVVAVSVGVAGGDTGVGLKLGIAVNVTAATRVVVGSWVGSGFGVAVAFFGKISTIFSLSPSSGEEFL
jgi:hypothetical protein